MNELQQHVEEAVEHARDELGDDVSSGTVKRRALDTVVARRGITDVGHLQEAAGLIDRVYSRAA